MRVRALLALALASLTLAAAPVAAETLRFRAVMAPGLGDIPLRRWDATNFGSGTFGISGPNGPNVTFTDSAGNDTDFYVPGPAWLQTGGMVFIKHNAVPINPSESGNPPGMWGPNNTNYGIYANCRLELVGPAVTKAALPVFNAVTPSPGSVVLSLSGRNISDGWMDKYANPVLATMYRLPAAGYYRLEVWCAAGTDAGPTRNNLGSIVGYNGDKTFQVWGRIDY